MPLFVKPARIDVQDVADVMIDHFEGTPLDMTTDIGAGGNALPYRWRPMSFSMEGMARCQREGHRHGADRFWFVGQSRDYLPDVVGGLIWFGSDDAVRPVPHPYLQLQRQGAGMPEGRQRETCSITPLPYPSGRTTVWPTPATATTSWLRQSARLSTALRTDRWT